MSESMTMEELQERVKRGAQPIPMTGNAPWCSNCGCSESMHNKEPRLWTGHTGHNGCDNHNESECWGGFDTSPGGTHEGTCTHRNGCKPWCGYMDEVIAKEAEDEATERSLALAAKIRKESKERISAYRKEHQDELLELRRR